MAEFDEREEELSTLSAIYPEMVIDATEPYTANIELSVTPITPLLVRFMPNVSPTDATKSYAQVTTDTAAAYIEHDVELAHLPTINLRVQLPDGYPLDSPPNVRITTKLDWLPSSKLRELEAEVSSLWEEYGRCQILFAYVDFLQQSAEQGFALDQSPEGCLVLPITVEQSLVEFDLATRQELFNSGTYDCGICLEPKKGSSCHQLSKCGHVFCKSCLLDFYNNAITEGDITSVKCLSPDCGKDASTSAAKRKRKTPRALQPRELLAIGVQESMVRRYVEMKRKKKIEADKSTVYCPRSWCQAPAKTPKYPTIPADLTDYAEPESASEDEGEMGNKKAGNDRPNGDKKNVTVPPNPNDRLAVCEKCSLAFCKVCYMGWHGPFARCYPRDPSELSAEEKASYEYIRLHTTPCPYCNSPTQKTMGCNHMICFTCKSHFCFLCSSWLDAQNPYQHFNKAGSECFQRLWELEEGDEGQAPADGRGFGGARGWEQMAIDAARAAEAQEAAETAQAEEHARLQVRMAQIDLDAERRARARRAGGRRPSLDGAERQHHEIQRFVAMAERDEEEGWDSDELGDDDGFVIQ